MNILVFPALSNFIRIPATARGQKQPPGRLGRERRPCWCSRKGPRKEASGLGSWLSGAPPSLDFAPLVSQHQPQATCPPERRPDGVTFARHLLGDSSLPPGHCGPKIDQRVKPHCQCDGINPRLGWGSGVAPPLVAAQWGGVSPGEICMLVAQGKGCAWIWEGNQQKSTTSEKTEEGISCNMGTGGGTTWELGRS